jgi:hypothetical protein
MFGIDTDIGLPAGEIESGPALPPESDRQVLPDGLEMIPTGPYLAGIVLATDVTQLNGHDAVRYLKASARMESRFAAGSRRHRRGRLLACLGSERRCRPYF